MLRNYLKIAFRGLKNQKLNTLINVLGLTVGLASFFLIYLYVQDELTYDHFHPDYEDIYRMSYYRKAENGSIEPFATSGTTWAPRYQELFPSVEEYAILTHSGYPGYINRDNSTDVYMEPEFKWSTSNFFQFFNFPLLKGNPDDVLNSLNSVVVTESTALKYFGNEDPIGKHLIYNVSGVVADLLITGIMKDPPTNTHIKPAFIGNIQQLHQLYMQQYQYDFLNQPGDAFAFTYIKVKDPNILEVMADDWKEYMSETFANSQNNQGDAYQRLKFTALGDMHFEPEMKWEIDAPANYANIPIFILVSILILVIACINFMNLTTARSAKRAREIGLRKTLGSNRKQIIYQFFFESFLMTFFAIFLAVVMVLLLLPVYNDMTGKSFALGDVFQTRLLSILLISGIMTALFSGSYPAFYLSGFKPMSGLRGVFIAGKSAENIRKGLVVFQFAISSILIICSILIYQQLRLINSSDLSKDKDRILSIRLGGFGLGNRDQVFRDLIEKDARFESVTVANHLPRLPHFGLINQSFRFPDLGDESLEFNKFEVDFKFAKTFNLEFVAGRDFSPEMNSDSNGIIINIAAAEALNMTPEETIGLTAIDQVYSQQLQQQIDLPGRVIGW